MKACQALLECQISLTCDFIRPYQDCLISLTCNFIRPYMNCQIRFTCLSFRAPHELSDKAHLIFFQTLPESRSVQNSFAFYPPSLHEIQPKNNLHSEEENGRNPLPYHDEIILRIGMPSPNTSSRNILYFHFLFRSFSLFCRRFLSHFSPASATGFLCLFSCFPAVKKVSKQCV